MPFFEHCREMLMLILQHLHSYYLPVHSVIIINMKLAQGLRIRIDLMRIQIQHFF